MRTYLEKRLETLITEHNNGQTALKNLEAQRVQLQETMLRIIGAIQVVQEALKDAPAADKPSATVSRAVYEQETAQAWDEVRRLRTELTALQHVLKDGPPVPISMHPGTECGSDLANKRKADCSGTQGGHHLERCSLHEGHDGDCNF